MKFKIIASLERRIRYELTGKNPCKYIASLNLEDSLNTAIDTLYRYTRTTKGSVKLPTMTEIICAIGHTIRNQNKLPQNSSLAAKTGAFFLWNFEEAGIIKVALEAVSNGHATYAVRLLNEKALEKLWKSIVIPKSEKYPSLTPFENWTTGRHATGLHLVKTEARDVLEGMTATTHPLVFNAVNKAQRVGWNVNKEIYAVYEWALAEKTEAFADIWEMQNPEAKASKLREARTIGLIAEKFYDETFYHAYTFDFRSRRYVSSAYLNEQGTDLAKGLLLLANRKPITKAGYNWLLISIASNWAGNTGIEGRQGRADGRKTDKIPLAERVEWVTTNLEVFLQFAHDPKTNQGWMKADKPWQFLAACIEFKNFFLHISMLKVSGKLTEDNMYSFKSGIVVYIDGSTNGSQHLALLSRDEETAPYVNLVASKYPGDLYAYVGDHIWETLSGIKAKATPVELEEHNTIINEIIEYRAKMNAADKKSELYKTLGEEFYVYKEARKAEIKAAAPFFWSRITDSKERRKICKRGTMTLS